MDVFPVNWDSVPEVMNKEQFFRICHISKSTALHLLKSGKVPCEWSGKKTRCYKIRKEDVKAYLEERAIVAERCERFRYCCIVGCQNDKRRVETSGGATRVGGTNPGMPQQRSLRKRMVPAARCYNNTPGKFLRHPSFFCGSSNPAK